MISREISRDIWDDMVARVFNKTGKIVVSKQEIDDEYDIDCDTPNMFVKPTVTIRFKSEQEYLIFLLRYT